MQRLTIEWLTGKKSNISTDSANNCAMYKYYESLMEAYRNNKLAAQEIPMDLWDLTEKWNEAGQPFLNDKNNSNEKAC